MSSLRSTRLAVRQRSSRTPGVEAVGDEVRQLRRLVVGSSIPVTMSMTGLAANPGTEVEPMCSIDNPEKLRHLGPVADRAPQ